MLPPCFADPSRESASRSTSILLRFNGRTRRELPVAPAAPGPSSACLLRIPFPPTGDSLNEAPRTYSSLHSLFILGLLYQFRLCSSSGKTHFSTGKTHLFDALDLQKFHHLLTTGSQGEAAPDGVCRIGGIVEARQGLIVVNGDQSAFFHALQN